MPNEKQGEMTPTIVGTQVDQARMARAIAKLRADGKPLTRPNITEYYMLENGSTPAAAPASAPAVPGMGQRVAPAGSMEERALNPDEARRAAQAAKLKAFMAAREKLNANPGAGMLPIPRVAR